MVKPLRGVSYAAPGANAALLFVAGGGPAASSRLASHLDHHTLHPVQLRFLGSSTATAKRQDSNKSDLFDRIILTWVPQLGGME
ncbi:hypothetical protein [Nitrosomonas sp. Nm33]|uniref:hypothetical protein n=1 Tax=Nitrosomonas sp. Nm33 TaxID=133724 RepID=UPI0008979265|nr:hypothetical protein [Nitrosomonas sp. Nm33]SDY03680.1 hypothetical protein SAMN05421755_100563 [Nitrosomonas sp. Nm33]